MLKKYSTCDTIKLQSTVLNILLTLMEMMKLKKMLSVFLAFLFLFLTGSSAYASTAVVTEQPVLSLQVEVDESCKTNVKFTALLDGEPAALGGPLGVTIEFYTGSAILCVYPNEYLGSAMPDPKGYATLGTWQAPGQYAGGAVIKSHVYGELFSNVCYYEVKTAEPAVPVLKLTAQTVNGISGNLNNNVILNAKLVFPENFTGPRVLAQPLKIDFYTGNPLVDMYPADLVATVYLIDGEAEITVPIVPGDYVAGAKLVESEWGSIYAPQAYFSVPKVGLNLDLKTSVESPGRKSTVTYTVAVSVDFYRSTNEVPNWPTGPVKVDFYMGRQGENTPMKLVGSAYTNRSGYASFSFTQSPGEYIGLATCDAKPYGKFQSVVVEYKVPSVSILSILQQFWQLFLKALGIRFI